MFLDMLLFTLFMGLFVNYLVRVLLFEEKTSHFGPWPSKRRIVIWRKWEPREDSTWPNEYTEYVQPVTFFDWVRRAFGMYAVSKWADPSGTGVAGMEETWYVIDARAEMWTCPTCLSFWMSLIPSLSFWLLGGNLGIAVFFMPFAISSVSVVLDRFENYLSKPVAEITYAYPGDDVDNADEKEG